MFKNKKLSALLVFAMIFSIMSPVMGTVAYMIQVQQLIIPGPELM